jgi:hypothetical protein
MPHRWGERPRRPEAAWIPWTEVAEIRLHWLGHSRRNLSLVLRAGDGGPPEERVFGDVHHDDAVEAFERLGCRIERDLNRSDTRVSVPAGPSR